MLNIGCGARTHHDWNNVDWSPYARLAARPHIAKSLKASGLLSEARYEKLQRVDPDIIAYDLRQGIPFDDCAFDVVYHSHVLEHISREGAPGMVGECRRVLKPGGILRVVVPDLEVLARQYLASLDEADADETTTPEGYDEAVDGMFEQMVRTRAVGLTQQKPVVRAIERHILGGTAADRGEQHLWMYDRFSLSRLLRGVGFQEISIRTAVDSGIGGWASFDLDTESDGSVYKPGSLFVEAVR